MLLLVVGESVGVLCASGGPRVHGFRCIGVRITYTLLPRTFYAHHAAAVSAAVQAHESLTLENAAASLARSLLANPSPLSRALVSVMAP